MRTLGSCSGIGEVPGHLQSTAKVSLKKVTHPQRALLVTRSEVDLHAAGMDSGIPPCYLYRNEVKQQTIDVALAAATRGQHLQLSDP